MLSVADYAAARKQVVPYLKGTTPYSSGAVYDSFFASPGLPSGGADPAETTSGIVPVAGDAGYPAIEPFAPGSSGHITRAQIAVTPFLSTIDTKRRYILFDRLFMAGSFAFNANATLSGQPSFASRLPGGDYKGLELYIGCGPSAPSGALLQVTIGYTNESGVAGRSVSQSMLTTTPSANAATVRVPLQAGDRGIQQIDSVQGSVATSGNFYVMIMRRLLVLPVSSVGGARQVFDLLRTGMPQVYAQSALLLLHQSSTSVNMQADAEFEIAEG